MSENVAFLVPVPRDDVELDLDAWLECYLADCEARGLTLAPSSGTGTGAPGWWGIWRRSGCGIRRM